MKLLLLSRENACYNLDNATTMDESQWHAILSEYIKQIWYNEFMIKEMCTLTHLIIYIVLSKGVYLENSINQIILELIK